MTVFAEIVLVCGGLLTILNLIVVIKNLNKSYVESKKEEFSNDNQVVQKMNDMADELKGISKKLEFVEEQLELQKQHNENTEKCLQNMFRSQARELYYKCVDRGNKITAKELTDLTEAHDIYENGYHGNHYFDSMFKVMKEFEVIKD